MTLWSAVADSILEVEGGYVDHPTDPGGETQWGISKRAYPHLDIRSLTREQAIAIYAKDYWDAIPEDLPESVRWFAFDIAVNSGVNTALTWLRTYTTLPELVAKRMRFYTSLGTWPTFGRGWSRRVATVLDHIARYEAVSGEVAEAQTVVLHNLTMSDRLDIMRAGTPISGRFVWRARGAKLDVRRVR